MFLIRIFLAFLGCTSCLTGICQVQDDFHDGNFTANPVWTGDTGSWTVNTSLQLQSAHVLVNSSFYLSTPSQLSSMAEWQFFARLNFNPSGLNYVDVFLTASDADLTQSSTTGYFIRIGNTQDEISLYRKDVTGIVKLVDGPDGIVNSGDNLVHIKVIRNASSQFTLFRDMGNTGNFIPDGSATDATYLTSAAFGFLVKQSTSGFFQKHYFDDILVKPFVPDLLPPGIASVNAVSANKLDVLFSEPVESSSVSATTHYSVSNGVGSPVSAQPDPGNQALVHLDFSLAFLNGISHTITMNGIKDLSGNEMVNGTAVFSFYTARRFDVVIDEIMADPSPPVSLPEAEYIELKNISTHTLNLSGWKISTLSTEAVIPVCIVPADSFIILSAVSNVNLFSSYGHAVGVPSFPSLDNNGTMVSIVSREGVNIHSVAYSAGWYQNAVKSSGGWSLEMIDIHNPCGAQNNWKASSDVRGGSPGSPNPVSGHSEDDLSPGLIRTFCPDSITVIATFDEPLDSQSAALPQNFSITGYSGILTPVPMAPMFQEVRIILSDPLQKGKIYTLEVAHITDCHGNVTGMRNKARIGLTDSVGWHDMVVNEIMFHPRPSAYDYVELYNRSNKVINAAQVNIANRNAAGDISSLKKICDNNRAVFPGDYMVITENFASLLKEYMVSNPDQVMVISGMPSFPNDNGHVIIVNASGEIIDEVPYSEKWHFALITNPEGIALERLEAGSGSDDRNNWHSASSTSGYGTPTGKNSQNREISSSGYEIEVYPGIFSPDNDGRDDFLQIRYQLPEPGYIINISIFDARGRQVKYLVKNALMGRSGSWTWDGLDENNHLLPSGYYVLYAEWFNLQGKKKQEKKAVVLAR